MTTLQYDTAEFLKHLSHGEYREAIRVYGGEFGNAEIPLAGRNFEDWRSRVANELRSKASAILSQLARAAESSGQWEQALEYADRLLEADPVNEIGRLVRLRILAATRPSTFVGHEVRVAREVYAEWGESIPGALQALLDLVGQPAVHADSQDTSRPTFVGRNVEFSALTKAWAQVDRSFQIVSVNGPAGVGKTRLVERYLRWTALKGARVLQTTCSPAEQRLAYSGIMSAWSEGIRPKDLDALSPGWLKYVLPFVPHLQTARGPQRKAIEVDQRVVFEANARLISSIADKGPVVIFCDNSNWLDDSSAWLLHYLYHKLRDRRIILVLTFRPEEIINSEYLRSLLETADSETVTNVPVDPLPHNDALILLENEALRTGQFVPPQLQHRIVVTSRGLPFHLLYQFKEACTNRECSPAEDGSDQQQAGLLHKLQGLSPGARSAIDALAILGRTSTVGVLEKTLGLTEGSSATVLSELAGYELVEISGDRVLFAHDIIHEQALGAIDPRRREELHAAAARAIKDGAAPRAALLALHLAAAGRDSAAATNAMDAAEEALVAFAFKDAEFFYQLAINRAPTADVRNQASAKYIDFLCSLERFDEALSWLKQLQVTGGINSYTPNSVKLLDLYRASIAGEASSELASQISALNSADGQFTTETGYRMLRILLQVAHVTGQTPSVAELSRYIENNIERLALSKAGCELLSVLARWWALYADSSQASDLATRALGAAERLRDPSVILTCMVSRAIVRMVRGDLYGAERDFDRVLTNAENPEFAHYRQRILNNVGLVLLERGKLAEAEARLSEALAFVSGPDQVMIRANLALVSLEEGAYATLSKRLKDLELVNNSLKAEWACLFAETMRGWIALNVGDVGDAKDRIRSVKAVLDSSAMQMDTSYSEILIARILGLQDAREGVAYCDVRAPMHRKRYVVGALRLGLEAARLQKSFDPELARDRAGAVLAEAESLGASNIARQAIALLSSA